ncbi:MAG: pyridoxamine 5'-phosphate oxidase family protein [Ilumatobacter sp.]
MDITMTQQDAREFLAGVHVGILAIAHEGHGPLALPIWYSFDDGDVTISISGSSMKAKLLRAAGRATMTVQSETPPYKYVSVEGPVQLEAPEGDNLSMAVRYLGKGTGQWYADNNPVGEDSVVVRLTPEKWRTTDYAKAMG